MRIVLSALSTFVLLIVLPFAALAQDAFPSRQIRIIVPFSPGPAPDAIARIAGQELSKRLHQTVIVENRTGAGGTIGAQYVAKSPPDGYTLFLATEAPLGISPIIYTKLGYDPAKDFEPISILARSGFYMIGCPTLPANNLTELRALARTRSLSYASSGIGSYHHLTGEMLKKRGGFEMTHVPYKGASEAMMDVMNCNVDIGFVAVGTVLPQIKAGATKFKILAVTTKQREPETPNIPTIEESGISGVDMEGYYGILAPAGTPKAVIERLSSELAQVMKTKAVADRIGELGMHVVSNSPQEFRDRIAADLTKFGKLAKEVKLDTQ